MRRYAVGLLLCAFSLAGCGGGGAGSAVPGTPPGSSVAGRFAVPQRLTLPVPPAPPMKTPATPSGLSRSPVTAAAHASFFAGEAPLSNGVYYLALPNGTPFGYYSYLTDSNYIYHFDLGYEYVVDANDGQGGVYFYDFASSHWWYTGRSYPFPYIYDFSLKAFLYYYPDNNNAGHYTTSPRYFYNFTADHIMTMPGQFDLSSDPLFISGDDQQCTTAAPAPGGATATECYDIAGGAGSTLTTVQEDFNEVGGGAPPYAVTSSNAAVASGTAGGTPGANPAGAANIAPHGAGTTLMTLTANNGQQTTFRTTVTVLNLGIQLNNLAAARSITLTTRYQACPFNDRVETLNLSSSTPSTFTYNLVNYPAYMSYVSSNGPNNLPYISACKLFRFVISVSDGANTIATKTVNDFLGDGTLNNQTIALP